MLEPEEIRIQLKALGVTNRQIADAVHAYTSGVRNVIAGVKRNRHIEEHIAKLLGMARLEVFKPNCWEVARSADPTLAERQAVKLQLKRMGLTQDNASTIIGCSRGSVEYVLNGRRNLPKVWKALQDLVNHD